MRLTGCRGTFCRCFFFRPAAATVEDVAVDIGRAVVSTSGFVCIVAMYGITGELHKKMDVDADRNLSYWTDWRK